MDWGVYHTDDVDADYLADEQCTVEDHLDKTQQVSRLDNIVGIPDGLGRTECTRVDGPDPAIHIVDTWCWSCDPNGDARAYLHTAVQSQELWFMSREV